ncbi:MAG: ATP-binding protein [Clostridia bacterium]
MGEIGIGTFGLREHLLQKIKPEEFNIIICDEEFRILEISKAASVLFDVSAGGFVAEFVDYDICERFREILKTKNDSIFFDEIDNVYFKIEASEHRGKIVLFFTDINGSRSTQSSLIAKKASERINDFIALSEMQEQKTTPETYDALLRLVLLSAKLQCIVKSDTINVTAFETGNITAFIRSFVSEVLDTVECNIELFLQDDICCDFSKEQLTVAFVNILEIIFATSGKEVKISFHMYRKDGNIHINICDNSMEIVKDLNLSHIFNEELSMLVVVNIAESHNGKVFIEESDKGIQFSFVIPSVQSVFDNEHFLESSIIYNQNYPNRKKLIESLNLKN